MNRRFLRPLFNFWEPFFNEPVYIKRVTPIPHKANKALKGEERKQLHDPHETFDNFYKEYYENTSALKPEEKEFFEKHYPEKVGKKFNAYETLGIDMNADIQKIKEAYRVNALKYHPKNNNSAEAKQKFSDISRAYNEILHEKQTSEYGGDVTTKSFFEDFHRDMESFGKNQTEQKGK